MQQFSPSGSQALARGKPIKRKFSSHVALSGQERRFSENEVIVTKTDLRGNIIYANNVFCRLAGVREDQVIGAPHSFLRHPDMPRAVFHLLWKQIESGKEIFAYVVNMAANGDHYWVFAHVTPSFDSSGRIIGYHSSRRLPDPGKLAKVKELYRLLKDIEDSASDRASGLRASVAKLEEILAEKGMSYDEFIFSL